MLAIISCLLFLHTGLCAAAVPQWRDRAMQIAADDTLSDSLKVIGISDLSYNYFYYYRTFDESYIEEYLQLTEAFAQGRYADDLFAYIYATAMVVVNSSGGNREMIDKCIDYTGRCRNPLVAARSWEYLGRKHVGMAVGLDYLHKGLKALEGSPHEYAALSRLYQSIAFYYSVQGDGKNETKYARLSLDVALQSGNDREIMLAWETVAESYYYGEDYPSAIEAYNEARSIYTGKLEPGEENEDMRFRDAMHYMIIGVNLATMYSHNGVPDVAAALMKEALDAARRTNMVETELYALKELGRIYLELKQYKQAEEYLLMAQRLLATDYVYTTESYYIAYDCELALAQLYDRWGEYGKSADYYRSAIEKYRVLNDEEQLAVNQQQAALYESKRQEEELARREMIFDYRERQKYFYGGIIVVVLMALFFVAKTFGARIKLVRRREKNLHDKARMLEKERRKTELDSELKQRERDALREKIVLGNSLRERQNETLQHINGFFAGHPELADYHQQLRGIVLQQSRIDSNVDELKQGMNGVPLDFYIRLQKTGGNRLSSLDLKYCRLLYLGTSTRDIAELLSVEPKTVKMQKYRLKQKLGLGREDDLNVFIRELADDSNDKTDKNDRV